MGLNYRGVDADSGGIGGDLSQEFHVLADSGEDSLFVSESGDFAANAEICPAIDSSPVVDNSDELPVEEFATPGLRTIVDLSKSTGVAEDRLVKTMFYLVEGKKPYQIALLVRGSDEVNPFKLKNYFKLSVCLLYTSPSPRDRQKSRMPSSA